MESDGFCSQECHIKYDLIRLTVQKPTAIYQGRPVSWSFFCLLNNLCRYCGTQSNSARADAHVVH